MIPRRAALSEPTFAAHVCSFADRIEEVSIYALDVIAENQAVGVYAEKIIIG